MKIKFFTLLCLLFSSFVSLAEEANQIYSLKPEKSCEKDLKNIFNLFEISLELQSGNLSPNGNIIMNLNVINKSDQNFEINNPLESLNILIFDSKIEKTFVPVHTAVTLSNGPSKKNPLRYKVLKFVVNDLENPISNLEVKSYFIKAKEKLKIKIKLDEIRLLYTGDPFKPILAGTYDLGFSFGVIPFNTQFNSCRYYKGDNRSIVNGEIISVKVR